MNNYKILKAHPIKSLGITFFMVLTFLFVSRLHAEEKNPVTVEMIPEFLQIQKGETLRVGFLLSMEKGWHTYWINPGDSGLATEIKWILPENVQAGPIDWPHPQVFRVSGMDNFGFEKETFLINSITLPASSGNLSKQFELKAQVKWLACKEICIPGEILLKKKITYTKNSDKKNSLWTKQYKSFQRKFPVTPKNWKIRVKQTEHAIVLSIQSTETFHPEIDPIFFSEHDALIDSISKQTIKISKNSLEIKLPKIPGLTKPPEALKGVLVAKKGWDKNNQTQAILINTPLK